MLPLPHQTWAYKAFSSNPAAAGQVGETFASVRPGINYIVNGGMVIDGSSNDKVVTTGGFSDTHQTAILNGHTYEVYNQGNAAQLLIDMNINRSAVL